MKLATKPRRRIDAITSIAPTMSVNVAVAASKVEASAPGTTSPNSAPARIAMVVVVVTLRTREVPKTA